VPQTLLPVNPGPAIPANLADKSTAGAAKQVSLIAA
jgi:hypothetical protein